MIDGEGFGAITTLAGGGRYNGLVEDIGGPETPGIGFALSIERLLMALEVQGVDLMQEHDDLDVYIAALGEKARNKVPALLHQLRAAGFSADADYMDKKMKGQMKAANRQQAKYVLILGDDELAENKINVKNMEDGTQSLEPLENVKEKLMTGVTEKGEK
jgi:histidyl-tRNA synthetase